MLCKYGLAIYSNFKNCEHFQLPLHLVVLTDDESVPLLRPLVDKFVSKLARVEVETEYFEASEISYAFLDEIMQLRAHFTSSTKAARKYADHLFMMAPFYHRVFPYDRLIMLDADLRFKVTVFLFPLTFSL